MALPLLALGAGALLGGVGNIIQGYQQRKAAETQADALREGMATQQQMFEQGQAQIQPFQQAGTQALGGLQQLTTPEGQAAMLEQYQQSPLFEAIRNQAVETTLRGASATGGLRTGGADIALASIAPQLQQQYLQGQQQRLMGLAQMGLGAGSQGAQQAQQLGTQLAGTQAQIGQQTAMGQTAVPMAAANTLGQIGGLATYYGTQGMGQQGGGLA